MLTRREISERLRRCSVSRDRTCRVRGRRGRPGRKGDCGCAHPYNRQREGPREQTGTQLSGAGSLAQSEVQKHPFRSPWLPASSSGGGEERAHATKAADAGVNGVGSGKLRPGAGVRKTPGRVYAGDRGSAGDTVTFKIRSPVRRARAPPWLLRVHRPPLLRLGPSQGRGTLSSKQWSARVLSGLRGRQVESEGST